MAKKEVFHLLMPLPKIVFYLGTWYCYRRTDMTDAWDGDSISDAYWGWWHHSEPSDRRGHNRGRIESY